MKNLAKVFLIGLFSLLLIFSLKLDARAEHVVLHSFEYEADYPAPQGNLTLGPGDILYGVTRSGGSSGLGTIYSMNKDGSDFTTIHEFSVLEGIYPNGSLILDSGTLYGTANQGGDEFYDPYAGTVFKVGTDGGGFDVLHTFSGGVGGVYPEGGLALGSGSTLYGTTANGGTSNSGILYSITESGSFTKLLDFSGTSGLYPGSYPRGTLAIGSDGTLYGTTFYGGTNDLGAVYSRKADGTFTALYEFSGTDGSFPNGTLTLGPDGTLYGGTYQGGTKSGTIFSIDAEGNFTTLHNFLGDIEAGGSDGGTPSQGLLLYDGRLYGMTIYGGTTNLGTIWSMNTDGSDYKIQHTFTGYPDDGANPQFGFILGSLYGTTRLGGEYDSGTLFGRELTDEDPPAVPEPATIISALLGLAGFAVKKFRK